MAVEWRAWLKYLRRYSFTLAFLALFLAWMWLRPDAPAQVYQLDGETMGTRYSVLVLSSGCTALTVN